MSQAHLEADAPLYHILFGGGESTDRDQQGWELSDPLSE